MPQGTESAAPADIFARAVISRTCYGSASFFLDD